MHIVSFQVMYSTVLGTRIVPLDQMMRSHHLHDTVIYCSDRGYTLSEILSENVRNVGCSTGNN